jgi:hypothetical protein
MMSRKSSNNSWLRRLRPLAVMAIAAALSASAFAQSQEFPTYYTR